MKNPGCANNRGSPLHASGNLSYQITLLSNAPAAMIFKPKPPPAMMMSHSPKPASVQISTFLGECLQVLENKGRHAENEAKTSAILSAKCAKQIQIPNLHGAIGGGDADPALWGLRFREARISRVMANAPSGFAAANLADIQDLMSAPAAVKLGRSGSGPEGDNTGKHLWLAGGTVTPCLRRGRLRAETGGLGERSE